MDISVKQVMKVSSPGFTFDLQIISRSGLKKRIWTRQGAWRNASKYLVCAGQASAAGGRETLWKEGQVHQQKFARLWRTI
jgi:hypothetical protein